jgi:hypothetical protein
MEYTIEELEKLVAESKKQYDEYETTLRKKRQEEEARKREKLAAEKEIRKKEIAQARDHYYTLLKEYLNDFGEVTIHDSHFNNKFWNWVV